MKIAVLYSNHTPLLSYNDDWLESFLNLKDLFIKKYNVLELSLFQSQRILFEYDYIVLLHSTNSNSFTLPKLYRLGCLNFRKAKIIYFVGNEYKLMPEKINFAKINNIEYIVSQLPQDTAEWLYAKTNSKIISLPHALNCNIFKPTKSFEERSIDIGNRSYEYPWYLGDVDRIKTFDFLDKLNFNLILDISTDPSKRFKREEWANFLNNCKFTIASEAGSSYLERDDKTRNLVNEYINKNPYSNFENIYENFFQNYKGESINGKCISSRHFDAVGTKTCQILLEGRYNDILEPNIHYLELKKDFSNINEVIEKMKNPIHIKEIVDNAYEYVINNHTHKHRIKYLFSEVMK